MHITNAVIDDTSLHYVAITKLKGDTVVVSAPAKGVVSIKKIIFLK